MKSERLYQAKEFAAKAGTTVRTLHFYDRKGLLKPAERSDCGYRLYGEAELERLEQILALRFVGFKLEHIGELLHGPARPLATALRLQREIIEHQKLRLETAIQAIEEAERALAFCEPQDRWETLRSVIEVFKMEQDLSWTKNYYTEEDRAKLAQKQRDTPQEVIEQGQRDWATLIAEVEVAAARREDPSSELAAKLASRWRDLIGQFAQGDRGIKQGLNRLWSDPTHWPKDFKRPWSDATDGFIHSAMNCEDPKAG